jgi:hypothetical protein
LRRHKTRTPKASLSSQETRRETRKAHPDDNGPKWREIFLIQQAGIVLLALAGLIAFVGYLPT